MYKLFIETDFLPSSLNKKLRSHRFQLHSENKHWDRAIAALVSQKTKPKRPLQKASISIIRYSHRMLDFDGLVGSMKPVVDALVSCGVLSDDSWNVTGPWNVNQKFRPKKDGPLLEIMVQGVLVELN